MRIQLAALATALLLGGNLSAQAIVHRVERPAPRLLIPLIPDSVEARWRLEGILRSSLAQGVRSVREVTPAASIECRMPVARLDSAGTSATLQRDITAGARDRDPMALVAKPNTCSKP